MPENKINLESLILKILEKKDQTNVAEIAQKAGYFPLKASDRRAIQRVLAHLIKKEKISAKGQARKRVYVLKNVVHRINQSSKLIQNISTQYHLKKSISYNPDFLIDYIPNKTFYLSTALREELLFMGQTGEVNRSQGTYARTILNRLLIDLSWNSSRLEGNSYSLLETKRLIELSEIASGKDALETQMILNHKEAIEYIVRFTDENSVNSHEICSIHALLSENLLGDPSASGRLRSIGVGISGTHYVPLNNHYKLKEYFDVLIEKFNLIKNPFEQSLFALIHLSYLQAFEDVNKRTSRLVANIPFIKHNLKPLSFVDVHQEDYVNSLLQIYEQNDIRVFRELYISAYKKSAEKYSAFQLSIPEPNLFKLKYRDAIRDIIRTIVLKPVPGAQIVTAIKSLIEDLNLSNEDSSQLFQLIEIEILSLHEGNIARFRITPNEFQQWVNLQK